MFICKKKDTMEKSHNIRGVASSLIKVCNKLYLLIITVDILY